MVVTLASSSSPLHLKVKPPLNPRGIANPLTVQWKRKERRHVVCRAELSGDAPFAAAIAASMLSSLLLPTDGPDSEGEEYSGLDSTGTRLAAMGIISFIPYFNWLSWVFAWLDTGKRRYGVYALVYLAPYLRSNMSLSPDESWLPLASIIFGIVHVQLEASIRNGDIQGFQLFTKVSNFFSPMKKDITLKGDHNQGRRMDHRDFLSDIKQSGKDVWKRGSPRKPSDHRNTSKGDWYDDSSDDRKH